MWVAMRGGAASAQSPPPQVGQLLRAAGVKLNTLAANGGEVCVYKKSPWLELTRGATLNACSSHCWLWVRLVAIPPGEGGFKKRITIQEAKLILSNVNTAPV